MGEKLVRVGYNRRVEKFRGSRPSGRRLTQRLLGFSGWLLLAVGWGMSIYAYGHLPQEVALWSSFWVRKVLRGEKSLLFFVYPAVQTVFFLTIRFLASAFFLRTRGGRREKEVEGPETTEGRLLELKRETVSLVLIFSSLVFIHLQTSLVLLSHRLVSGVNPFYLGMLLAVLLILFPYYAIRRRMLLRPDFAREDHSITSPGNRSTSRKKRS